MKNQIHILITAALLLLLPALLAACGSEPTQTEPPEERTQERESTPRTLVPAQTAVQLNPATRPPGLPTPTPQGSSQTLPGASTPQQPETPPTAEPTPTLPLVGLTPAPTEIAVPREVLRNIDAVYGPSCIEDFRTMLILPDERALEPPPTWDGREPRPTPWWNVYSPAFVEQLNEKFLERRTDCAEQAGTRSSPEKTSRWGGKPSQCPVPTS